jgi:5'(3')-deoxyribonucleotidase
MVVGIDIDDTMTNHCESWFDAYNRCFKREELQDLKLEDAYKWDFYKDWEEEDKERLFNALHSEEYFKNLQLKPDVQDIILKIINSDNKVVIISATVKEYQEEKKNWLLEQIPILSEKDIIFTADKELINVDIMIDDNIGYAPKFKCPFLLFKQPWNTGRPPYEYSENIVNVGNWQDIGEILTKMGIINISISSTEDNFSEATQKLIEGIKNAQTDKECVELLNPYIKLWQQQGMIMGMKQINDATMLVIEDILEDMNAKK